MNITHFTQYIAFLVSTLLSVTVTFAQPICVVNKTCVPVIVNNVSGKDLYIEIHGSQTNLFFNFMTGKYTSDFSTNNNLKRIANQTQLKFYLPGNGIVGGARMYLSTHTMYKIPDLATYPYIYDTIEMGWSNNGTAVWNTTSVDFFGMPMNMRQDNIIVGFKDGTIRSQVISELKSAIGKESKLYDARFFMHAPNSKKIVRVFSPLHFYTSLPDMWHQAIVAGLNSLASGAFTSFTYGGNYYTNFKKLSNSSISIVQNGATVTLTGINTGNAAAGRILPIGNQFAGMLAAVINRGVLGSPEKWGENGGSNIGYPDYYYPGPVGYYRYNTYAKILISHAINKKLYATSYDDFWHMESSINVGSTNNKPITIKVMSLQ